MRPLQRVIWQKGCLLQPQHMQAQERYVETLIAFLHGSLMRYPYGFLSLHIDQHALSEGTLSVVAASGIGPDGMVFDWPTSEPPPAARPIASAFASRQNEEERDSADFFLSLPIYRPEGPNLTHAGHSDARFAHQPSRIRDENTGLQEKDVMLARKNFRLLSEREVGEDCVSLPIARVIRADTHGYALDPSFAAPVLSLGASEPLTRLVLQIADALAAKSSQLGMASRQLDDHRLEWSATEIDAFWLRYTVNSALPFLRHSLSKETGNGVHPERVFAHLLRLAGSLTAFSESIQLKDLPPYRHDQLGTCFRDLTETIRALLNREGRIRYESLPMHRMQPGVYGCRLEPKHLNQTMMYLAIDSRLRLEDLKRELQGTAKICSLMHLDHFIRHAKPTVGVRHSAPPSAVAIKMNYHYFQIEPPADDHQKLAWETILRAGELALYLPASGDHVTAELIVVFEGSAPTA